MVYVPGAFTWVEFDYEMIDKGAAQGLTFEAYKAWHDEMVRTSSRSWTVQNSSPLDDMAYKLVYTGEDYPYSDRFGDEVALFAQGRGAGRDGRP